jgi:hypothetical protein
MGSLNFKEVGQPIRIDFNEDISLATPTLVLEPQLGVKKDITDGVTIPNTTIIVGSQTLTANEYMEYFTKEEDLDYVGQWRFKGELNFSSTDIRQSDYERFTVKA